MENMSFIQNIFLSKKFEEYFYWAIDNPILHVMDSSYSQLTRFYGPYLLISILQLIQENATIEETATTEQTTKEDITEEVTTYGKTGNETTVGLEMTIQKVTNSSNKLNGNSLYLFYLLPIRK